MQRPDEQKRRKIADTAARLFVGKPFHEVRLDDVAAAAHVGKGTLYVYFRSKEDLYASLLFDAFADLVHRLDAIQSADTRPDPRDELHAMIRELVAYAFQRPFIFELARFINSAPAKRKLSKKRAELFDRIESTIRRGNQRGCWSDRRPSLTAAMIPGLVRSAMLYGPKDIDEADLSTHIIALLQHGLSAPRAARAPLRSRTPRLVGGGVG